MFVGEIPLENFDFRRKRIGHIQLFQKYQEEISSFLLGSISIKNYQLITQRKIAQDYLNFLFLFSEEKKLNTQLWPIILNEEFKNPEFNFQKFLKDLKLTSSKN